MKNIKALCGILLCGVMLSTNILSVCAVKSKSDEKTITIQWPGKGEDASPAIQEAVKQAETAGGNVTIEFEKGKQYEIYPETAYHNMNYYISNAATKSENPNGERWSAIFMKDMENITVEGNDAMLNIHGVMTPLLLDGCKNVTFQNLHVDWARPTMSELNVTEVGDGYARVKVGEGSLFVLENEGKTLRWVSEKKPDGDYYWTLTGGLSVRHDPEANTARMVSFPYPVKFVDEGNGTLKLEYNGTPSLKVGDNYQFRSGSRDQVGSFIHKCENVKFDNMGFHYMHGLGIVSQYTKNISFNKMDCTPRKETGRKCASSADFVQVSGCSGLVSVTDSKFSGAHDDVFNIHGTHLRIVEKDEAANQITVRFMQERSWGFQAFDIGDEIEFVKPDTMLNYASNKVKDFERLDDYLIRLTLEKPLPEDIGLNADVVENITATPDVYLKGNYAENVTTRGVLCTTRGDVLIEDNTFYKNGMSGVLLEDDVRQWFESGPIKNMTIKNNKFVECGGPQIFSNPQTSVYDPLKTVHSNIQIVGNEFTGNSTIKMLSTKDLVIDKNTFKDGGSIELSACNGIGIGENKGVGNISVSNSLNEKSLADFKVKSEETIEEIDRSGMTATANNERAGYAASNLLDGKNDTIWHTDWDNIPAEDPYVEIDLNGQKTFNRLSYLPRQGETGGNIKACELWIKVKRTDSEFTKAAEGIIWGADGSEKQINLDSAVTAEVVRLVSKDSVYDSVGRLIASGAEIRFQNVVKNADSIPIGKNISLSYEAAGKHGAPADLRDAKFTYSSDNEKVAKVSENGIITGVKEGQATITVTVEAYGKTFTDSAVITVTEEVYKAAERIEITAPEGNQMNVNVVPAEAADDVEWSVERLSGARPSITKNGLLMMDEAGRVKVTASSKNDPSIKDEMIIVAVSDGEAEPKFQWVRENKSNWTLSENAGLKLKLEPGALWSGTTNTAKNILTRQTGKEDCTIITKMNYRPSADYAESGIAFYTDDDNYVFLSRKKHSGYGGNILSVITEMNGNAQESPATNRVMDDVEGKDIFLKLVKAGNQYSGYYSADGEEWKAVWENREVNLGTAPKAAIAGYGNGNETAVYDYLQIDDSKMNFESLIPQMQTAEGVITSIETPLTVSSVVGTKAEDLALPASLEVTWNDLYKDHIEVQWDLGSYSEEQETGTYEYTGTLVDPGAGNLAEGVEIKLVLQVSADKTALGEAVELAKLRKQAAYTEETWTGFAAALEEAQGLMDDLTATQEKVDAALQKLTEAMENLVINGTIDGLSQLAVQGTETMETYKEQLYDDELPPEDWENQFYSAAKYTALGEKVDTAKALIEKLEGKAPEEELTEEEKVELVNAISQLQTAQDEFLQSRCTVNVQAVKTWLNAVTDPQKYTPENWDVLVQVWNEAAALIDENNGVHYTQRQVDDMAAKMKAAFENQKEEKPDTGDEDNKPDDEDDDTQTPDGGTTPPVDGTTPQGGGNQNGSHSGNSSRTETVKSGDYGTAKSVVNIIFMGISFCVIAGIVVIRRKNSQK